MKKLLFWLCVGAFAMFCLNEYVRGEESPCPYIDEYSTRQERAEGFCELWNEISISNGFDIRFSFDSDYVLIVKNINSCVCEICIKSEKAMALDLSSRWFELVNSKRVECWNSKDVLVIFIDREGNAVIACEVF